MTKGEDAPEIGATGPVTGIAYKDCSWKIPYKVNFSLRNKPYFIYYIHIIKINGYIQSPLEVSVFKDGKELKIGQDVNISIKYVSSKT